jgi:hypothetical protein
MFPISADKLTIEKIADYWSRDIQPSASWKELVTFLEAAWWRGEIKGQSVITRLALLKSMFNHDDAAGIVFFTEEDTPPLPYIELPDGELKVDLRPKIIVPSTDPDMWRRVACDKAFQALAKLPSFDHYPNRTIQFLMMELTRDEFQRLLTALGIDLPEFWRSPIDNRASLNRASDAEIKKTIQYVYNSAHDNFKKPPNIKELATPVLEHLRAKGYTSSKLRIQTLGGEPQFKNCRRPPGKTLSSEKRSRRK